MDIPSISSSTTGMGPLNGSQVAAELSAAVMKQTLEIQRRQGEALVQMIQATTPTLDGTGQIVNVGA